MASKAELRRTALAARRAAPDLVAGDALRTPLVLEAVAGAGCVTCYVSVGSEPNTRDVILSLAGAGVRVLLPRLRTDGGLELVDRPAHGCCCRSAPAAYPPRSVPPWTPRWPRSGSFLRCSSTAAASGWAAGVAPTTGCCPTTASSWRCCTAGELVDALPAEPHDRLVTHAVLPTGVMPVNPDRP